MNRFYVIKDKNGNFLRGSGYDNISTTDDINMARKFNTINSARNVFNRVEDRLDFNFYKIQVITFKIIGYDEFE